MLRDSIAFFVLIPILVSGSASKSLVALMKHHYQEDNWNNCLIITLGLELKYIHDLVKKTNNLCSKNHTLGLLDTRISRKDSKLYFMD